MYIKRIQSNIKGGVDQQLGEKTLIVGPNGIGKSAIVNAIELAVGGSASDIVGRAEVKREADLLALGDGKRVFAEAEFSDGSGASYETNSNNRGGAKKATHVCPIAASFPVRDVRAALGGSADTARSWLLSKVVQDVTRDDVLAWFTPEATALYGRYAKAEHKSEIDILLFVHQAAAKKARAEKKRLTTEKGLLERLGANLDAEPTASVLEAARQAEEDALSAYEAALKATSNAGIQEQAERLKEIARIKIEEMDSAQRDAVEVQNLTPPGGSLTEQEEALVTRIVALADVHKLHLDIGADSCLVCERPGAVDHHTLQSKKMAVSGTLASRKDWWDTAKMVFERAQVAEKAAQAALEDYLAVEAVVVEEESPKVDTEEAKNAWQRAQMKHAALSGATKQWQNLRGQKDSIRLLRADISDLEELTESTKQAINRLVKNAVEQFEQDVQAHLPETDTFKLLLEENGKEVCRFGFERDGFLHSALSGAEWARLTLALACASSSDSGLLIFTPEERAFDPGTLREVMAALSDAPGQVLITSPIKHKGRLPKGWTIIEVGDAGTSHSTQTQPEASINA